MNILSLVNRIPAYAKDISQNIKNIFSEPQEGLSRQQLFGAAVAASLTIKDDVMLNAIFQDAKLILDANEIEGIKAAVAIMLQNNTYFRYWHAMENEEVKKLPSDLYMSVISNPNIDIINFEIYMFITSIINGCEYCSNLHSKKLIKKGLEPIAIRNLIRLASVIKAVSDILAIERIRSYDFPTRGENL